MNTQSTLSRNTKLLTLAVLVLGFMAGALFEHEAFTEPAKQELATKQEAKFREGFGRGAMCMAYIDSAREKGIDVPNMDKLCDQYIKPFEPKKD